MRQRARDNERIRRNEKGKQINEESDRKRTLETQEDGKGTSKKKIKKRSVRG